MKRDTIPLFVERFFIPITAALCAVALAHPPSFTWIKPHIPLFLGIIMFGMGLTLEFADFRNILSKWRLVGFGVFMQYAVMPVLAVGISFALRLPPKATVGMVLVGACPGGTASNVVAYLARANVPLSVTPDPGLHLSGTGPDARHRLPDPGAKGGDGLLGNGRLGLLDRGLSAGGRAHPAPPAAPLAGAVSTVLSLPVHSGSSPCSSPASSG